MELRRQGRVLNRAKWGILALVLLLIGVFVTGPVMRERDQAALLSGAISIVRTGEVFDAHCYNYDRQVLSYWALALVIKVAGLEHAETDLDTLVWVGNLCAAIPFVISLCLLLLSLERTGSKAFWLVFPSVLAPVVVFSAPLLSSNLFSFVPLAFLVLVLRKGGRTWLNKALCGGLTFLAVGFRSDAVLILPMICLLAAPRPHLSGLLHVGRFWAMGIAACAAIGLGLLITTRDSYDPGVFFDPRMYAGYVAFGLLGALLALVAVLLLVGLTKMGGKLYRVFLIVAILAPLSYYSFYLFTPRHLLLTALIPLLFACSRRGAAILSAGQDFRLTKWATTTGAMVTLIFSLIGIRFITLPSFEVTAKHPTLYPTADGFWPMGGTLGFIGRLREASERPIDHNQRVWDAWRSLDVADLPAEPVRIQRDGLVAFGSLATELRGRLDVRGYGGARALLVSDRSLGKKVTGFRRDSGDEEMKIDWSTCWLEEIATGDHESLYLVSAVGERERSLEQKWVARILFREVVGEDDFAVLEGSQADQIFERINLGHRIAVLWSGPPDEGFMKKLHADSRSASRTHSATSVPGGAELVSFVLTEELSDPSLFAVTGAPRWVAVVVLPAFMSVDEF